MSNTNIKINQTVAILCDGNNIERSLQSMTGQNVMINWDAFIPKLLNGRGLNRLIYFREGKHISSKLAERLHDKFYGSVVPCHKSADIPLSIKATQLASKVDTIIIMSGDSDYVDLVNHLKSEGVRIEVAAVKANTARMLLDRVDYFHAITEQDVFSYNMNTRRPKPLQNHKHHGKPADKQETQQQPVKDQHKEAAQQVVDAIKPKDMPKDDAKDLQQEIAQELAREAEREEREAQPKKESMLSRAIKSVVGSKEKEEQSTSAHKKTATKKRATKKKTAKKTTTKKTAKKKTTKK